MYLFTIFTKIMENGIIRLQVAPATEKKSLDQQLDISQIKAKHTDG